MSIKRVHDLFLLDQFQEFYFELIRQKKIAGLLPANPIAPEVYSEDNPDKTSKEIYSDSAVSREILSEKSAAHPIYLRLLSILEQQVVEARKHGGEYGVAFYKEAQYVMAALADEIFVHMDWDGKHAWKANLLEYKLFGTYVAGEFFFQKVEKILKETDPAYSEMASICLLAISFGFRGKYRDIDDKGMLTFYRKQLFTYIYQKNSDLLSDKRRLFPEPYEHTLEQGTEEELPYLRWWIVSIIGIFVLCFIISYFIWVDSTDDLFKIVEKILIELKNK